MSENEGRKIFYGWYIAAVSLFVTATGFGILYSFGIFFKIWIAEFQCSRAFLSGVFSVAFLFYGISSTLLGAMTDRFGPRKTLASGGLIMGAGAILTSLVSAGWFLYVSFGFLIGIGVGASYSPTVATVSRWFIRKKGIAVGMVVSGLGVGNLVYAPLAKLLISLCGWRVTFQIFSVLICLIYFFAAHIFRGHPRELGLTPYGSTEPRTTITRQFENEKTPLISPSGDEISDFRMKTTIRMAPFWILFFVHCFWVFGVTATMVHLVPNATDIGMNPKEASILISVLGGVSVLGRIGLGFITDIFGTKKLLLLLLFLQVTMFLWLSESTISWMLWIFVALFGLSYGALSSVFPMATTEYFGLRSMGSIFGLLLLGATLGGIVGPWVVGYVFDLTGTYRWGFLAAGASGSIGLLMASYLPAKSRRNCKGLGVITEKDALIP